MTELEQENKALRNDCSDYLQTIKTLSRKLKQNVDLTNKAVDIVEEWKKKTEELESKIKHLTKHLEPQAMTALFEQVEEEVKQEQRIKELEQENAELRNRNQELLESCKGATMMYKDLQKAKELLRELIDTPVFNQMGGELYENEGYTELVAEVEQFLKE